jgi:hypothetical protein
MAAKAEAGKILDPLIAASSTNQISTVQSLLKIWKPTPDPLLEESKSEATYYLRPAFEIAVQNGHPSVVSYFLSQGFRITPKIVTLVIESGSIGMLEVLLDYGWHPNQGWDWDMSPLR